MALVPIHNVLIGAKFSRQYAVPSYMIPVIVEAWREFLPRGESDITVSPTMMGSDRQMREEYLALKRDFPDALKRVYPTEYMMERAFTDAVADGIKYRFADGAIGDIRPIVIPDEPKRKTEKAA